MSEEIIRAQKRTERREMAAELGFARPSESLWRDAWRRLLRNRAAMVSGIFVIVIILVAILADDGIIAWVFQREAQPLLAPYGYKESDFNNIVKVGEGLVISHSTLK